MVIYHINYNLKNFKFGMYGKLNERKLHESDYIMSCQKAREQLSEYLNEQSKRVNVDSAKKRAVVQHMDYDGFRQMVLGANIFPTKSKQLTSFTKGENLPALALRIDETNIEQERVAKKTQQEIVLQKIQGKSEMHCNSFRQFKKKFNQHYTKQFDQSKTLSCYNLIKQQNQQRLRKIFNTECEGNILVKIVNIFDQVITEMTKNKTEGVQRQISFMVSLFKTILSIPTMKSMTLSILSKKQRQTIADFIRNLGKVHTVEIDEKQIEELANVFVK